MYRTARGQMSVEEAAWRLHIGGRSLYRYERGEQATPPDVVCMMAKVYAAPWLPKWHCVNRCPIGMQYGCPETKETAPCGAA